MRTKTMRAAVMVPTLLTAMLVALFVSGASVGSGAADYPGSFGELSLGSPDSPEFRTRASLAPGLDYTRVVRGETSEEDSYTVDVVLTEDRKYAEEIAERLREDGHGARVEEISERPQDDPDYPALSLVRSGKFDTEVEAAELAEELAAEGYGGSLEEGGSEAYGTPSAVHTAEDGSETTGPWVVSVIEVSPDFEGEVSSRLATREIPGKDKLTDISSRADSLAAVNGGYFVVESEDGTEGDLAGVSAVEGDLVSEAVNGRSSLILSDAGTPRVAEVHTFLNARTTDGERRVVDGLNREPGLIRSCGGVGGDEPTEQPKHDSTCADESELILFTGAFGDKAEAGEGTEVALDPEGRVTKIRNRRGGDIPEGGAVLSGTGGGAGWLEENAGEGEIISVSEEVFADGEPLPLEEVSGMINGGPRLLRGGEVDVTAEAEGFDWPEDYGFYYGFGIRRNPRTLAGVRPDGTLLLVTVEGSSGPGYSVGASFEESAELMRSLGAEEALNLDGGGSTTLTAGESLLTLPTDDTGERPIGDAIVVLDGGNRETPLPQTGGDSLERSGPLRWLASLFESERESE